MHFIVHDILFEHSKDANKVRQRSDLCDLKKIEKEQKNLYGNYATHFVIGWEKAIYARYTICKSLWAEIKLWDCW